MTAKIVPTLEQIVKNSQGKFEQAIREALHSAIDKLTEDQLLDLAFKQHQGKPLMQANEQVLKAGLLELDREDMGYPQG